MIVLATIFLLSGWILWFVSAPLSLTQTSETAVLQTNDRLFVTFSPRVTTDLSPGQPVKIIFDDFPESVYGSLSGQINKIEPNFRDGRQVIEISINSDARQFPLQRGLTGQVEVVTETRTPAELLWLAVKRTIVN